MLKVEKVTKREVIPIDENTTINETTELVPSCQSAIIMLLKNSSAPQDKLTSVKEVLPYYSV